MCWALDDTDSAAICTSDTVSFKLESICFSAFSSLPISSFDFVSSILMERSPSLILIAISVALAIGFDMEREIKKANTPTAAFTITPKMMA